ncbi:PLP-dependent aminotransferase family protein [Pseudomaricurvus sp.]|uniref:aminotransferase-like domain-containing protein n=1 Tax=Pseudomaricurvus sp. TaxID=2004510 RepID=UPI003F6D5F8F
MTLQISKPQGMINLGVGQPDPDLLPTELFHSVSVGPLDLAYGQEAGDQRFREALSHWLTEDCGRGISPEQLLVTTGSSNALDMICSRLAQRGDTVLVEDPTYFIALNLFVESGLNVVAVPMDDEGLCPASLESAIQQHNPAFIYTIPTFHNPTGITQPNSRRQSLVALAKRYQCPLVADEVYQSLYFGQRPPPPLACFDDEAPVLSVGTFSKILAPGLRLGWIQGSGESLQPLLDSALLKSGGGLAPVTSSLVATLIEQGDFQTYLNNLKAVYQARKDCLYHGLRTHLGERWQVNNPDGGYFLWANCADASELPKDSLARAKSEGVGYLAGSQFSVDHHFAASMRLCFAWYPEAELIQACERLGRVFNP